MKKKPRRIPVRTSDLVETFGDLKENLYGHRKKVLFMADRITRWENLHHRSPSILDVGCGTGGVLTIPLGRLGHPILGIDRDEPSITSAKAANPHRNVEFRTADVNDLKGPVDVVILSEVLEHLTDPGRLLRDCLSLLASDGIVLITVPNGFGPFELEKLLWKFLRMDRIFLSGILPWLKRMKTTFSNATPSHPPGPTNTLDASPHVQFYTFAKISRIVENTGLSISKFEKGSFIAGPFTDTFLPKWTPFLHGNSTVGSILPASVVSGWYFECRRGSWQAKTGKE